MYYTFGCLLFLELENLKLQKASSCYHYIIAPFYFLVPDYAVGVGVMEVGKDSPSLFMLPVPLHSAVPW